MYCTNCGKEIDADSLFCPECGQKIEKNYAKEKTIDEQDETPVNMSKLDKINNVFWTIRYWGSMIAGFAVGIGIAIMTRSIKGVIGGLLLSCAGVILGPWVLGKQNSFIKRMLIALVGVGLCYFALSISGTQDMETEEKNESKQMEVGDELSYHNEDGGKGTVTIIDWGSITDSSEEQCLYINLRFKNVGDKDLFISNDGITVYSHGQYIKETYLYNSEGLSLATLAPGYETSGKLFYKIDPDQVANIEVNVMGFTCVLKNESDKKEEIQTEQDDSEENIVVDNDSPGNYQTEELLAASDKIYTNDSGHTISIAFNNDYLDITLDDYTYTEDELNFTAKDDKYIWYYGKGLAIEYSPAEDYFFVSTDDDSNGYYYQKNLSEEDEDEYILPTSGYDLISESDLDGLSKETLRLARNEISARHGRKFKDQGLQDYFNSQSWYHGTIEPDAFSEDMLSEVENKNIELISKKEESMTE